MGEIKTGSLSGHLLAASFFLGFGVFILWRDLKLAQELHPGQSFCQTHVPIRSPLVLRRGGMLALGAMVVGLLWEGGGGILTFQNFFFQLLHEALYLSFGFVGFVSILESKRRLPVDSSRVALVVAQLLFYLMMSSHSRMKPGVTDGSLHAMLANLCLAHALVLLYSVCNNQSLVAYVLGNVLMVMVGIWLVTLGFYACDWVDIQYHLVETIFSLELLGLLNVVVSVAALALPPREEDGGHLPTATHNNVEYKHLVQVLDTV